MGYEDFTHKIGTEHNYVEKPDDNGWGYLNEQVKERELNIVGLLDGLQTNKTKRDIIEKAIIARGLAWNDLLNLNTAPKATEALTRMVAFWDTPTEDGQKSEQAHKEEADNFARLLSEEI